MNITIRGEESRYIEVAVHRDFTRREYVATVEEGYWPGVEDLTSLYGEGLTIEGALETLEHKLRHAAQKADVKKAKKANAS